MSTRERHTPVNKNKTYPCLFYGRDYYLDQFFFFFFFFLVVRENKNKTIKKEKRKKEKRYKYNLSVLHGIMVTEQDSQTFTSEFESHLVPPSYQLCLMPHLKERFSKLLMVNELRLETIVSEYDYHCALHISGIELN